MVRIRRGHGRNRQHRRRRQRAPWRERGRRASSQLCRRRRRWRRRLERREPRRRSVRRERNVRRRGGGGAAGGLSWGADKSVTYSTRSVSGDGLVLLEWTVASDTTSNLTAPASAPQGRPVTLTDTISPAVAGGPAIAGEVNFEMIDVNSYAKAMLGTAKVADGVATFTTSSLPPGQYQGIHVIFTGNDNYQGSTSDFVYPKITAPIKTVSLSPASLTSATFR